MKRLEQFMTENPSYTKWGNERLATKLNLKVSTVEKFKKSATFKTIKSNYINSI